MFVEFASRVARPRSAPACVSLLLAAGFATIGAAKAHAETWPSEVKAAYRVTFNGFDIGSFRFTARVGREGYTLDSKAELSALLGAFQWTGGSHTTGIVQNDATKPSGYAFDYQSSSKSGSIRMGAMPINSRTSGLPRSQAAPANTPTAANVESKWAP